MQSTLQYILQENAKKKLESNLKENYFHISVENL